jgi:predicted MFS family arabinose efflux permease
LLLRSGTTWKELIEEEFGDGMSAIGFDMLTLGAVAVVVGAGMALLIEDDPHARGIGPDGNAPLGADPPRAAGTAAIVSRSFIGLYAACLICSLAVFVSFVYLVPYATDHGIPQSSAILLLGVIGIGSTARRFFLGGAPDRIGRETALVATFVGMAALLTIWAVSTTFWPLAAFAFLYGVFCDGWVAALPAWRPTAFGDLPSAR